MFVDGLRGHTQRHTGEILRHERSRPRVFGSAMAIALGAVMPAWAHGVTERVSLGPGGAQGDDESFGSAISADGRFVAFESYATNLVPGDTNGLEDVFVRDRKTGTTRRVSLGPGGVQGDAGSFLAAISANGRFVAFASDASNLVPGDTNGQTDVFVRDRKTGTTRRVGRRPGRSGEFRPIDLGGRAFRRLRVECQQLGAGRHQRCGRLVLPRP